MKSYTKFPFELLMKTHRLTFGRFNSSHKTNN